MLVKELSAKVFRREENTSAELTVTIDLNSAQIVTFLKYVRCRLAECGRYFRKGYR